MDSQRQGISAGELKQILTIVSAILVGCALTGCASRVDFTRGEVIETQTREVSREAEHRLEQESRLDDDPASIIIILQRRDKVTLEHRDIYEKVEVHKDTVWLHPDFFLWPTNVVRTGAGLAGSTYFLVVDGVHAAGALAGLIAGGAGGLVIAAETDAEESDGEESVAVAFAVLGAAIGVAVSEAPVAILDLPLLARGRVVAFPMTRDLAERDDMENVREAFRARWEAARFLWHFAWDYKVYSPFFSYPAKLKKGRRVVHGETIEGPWEVQIIYTKWEHVTRRQIKLIGPTVNATILAPDGTARIELLPLIQDLRYDDTLSFWATTEIGGRTLAGQITTPVSVLRDPAPPVITVKPEDGSSHRKPTVLLRVAVAGDTRLSSIVVRHNGALVANLPGGGRILDYAHEIKSKISLRNGKNTIEVAAEDVLGSRTEKTVEIHRE